MWRGSIKKPWNWTVEETEEFDRQCKEVFEEDKPKETPFYEDIIKKTKTGVTFPKDLRDALFNEETDNYEPFTPYIKRKFNEYIDRLQTFRFNVC